MAKTKSLRFYPHKHGNLQCFSVHTKQVDIIAVTAVLLVYGSAHCCNFKKKASVLDDDAFDEYRTNLFDCGLNCLLYYLVEHFLQRALRLSRPDVVLLLVI